MKKQVRVRILTTVSQMRGDGDVIGTIVFQATVTMITMDGT